MVPYHPHHEVLMLQQSLSVQLEHALLPWEPLQFFESSLAARVYLSGHLAIFFTCVFLRSGQQTALWSQSSPTL